jgi:K+-sensing histidine kinase KdpD
MVQSQLAAANAGLEARVSERTTSLRETVEQLEVLLQRVSDLRAPLRAMLGYAVSSGEDYGAQLDEQAREYLDRIIRSGGRMDRLILDILTYSRLESPRDPPAAGAARWARARDRQTYLQSTHATISIPKPLPSVIGHEPYLTQVLSNMLDNAVKFVRRQHPASGSGPSSAIPTPIVDRGQRHRDQARAQGSSLRHVRADSPGQALRGHRHRPRHRAQGCRRMGGQTGVESDGLSGAISGSSCPRRQP